MIFAHTLPQVLSGEKTRTTRRLTPKTRLLKVGKTYAVQPGRGKKAVARIRILKAVAGGLPPRLYRTGVDYILARAEGFAAPDDFNDLYAKMHGAVALDEPCVVYWFDLVKEAS